MPIVVSLTWLGFLGWLGALLLAIGAVVRLLALVAFFGGGRQGHIRGRGCGRDPSGSSGRTR